MRHDKCLKDCILYDSCCVACQRADRGFSGEAAPYKFVGGTLTSAVFIPLKM